MHNIVHNIETTLVLAPQTVQAAAVNSGTIDTQGSETLAVVVMVGTIGETLDSENRIDLKIEHADDNGSGAPASYSPCTDDDVQNASDLSAGIFAVIDHADKAQKRHMVEYTGGKRFVKVTATPVSLATGGPVAMLALAGNAAQKPVSNT
jgi:hypothetical protein